MNVVGDIRLRLLLVATIAVAAAGAAAAFSFTAAKRYRATAVIVVQPVSPATLPGVDVLHDTQKRTAAATAARLVHSAEVAEAVRVRLGLHGTAQSLLREVSTRVVPQSNAVEVQATDTDPARAAQIANGFVDAFITSRSAGFQSEVTSSLARLRRQLAQLAPAVKAGPEGDQLRQQIGELAAAVGTSDPTVRHGSAAQQPDEAAWPHPVRWTVEAGLGGLAAGALLALLWGGFGAIRRRRVVGTAEYDPRVSERATERLVRRLEQRLGERVDALAEERARLAEREATLATREHEVAVQLEQARAATSELATKPAAREEEEAARVEELAQRERELADRAEGLDRRERALTARAAELEQIEARLDERKQALDEREAAQPAAQPPVRVSGPVEGVSGEAVEPSVRVSGPVEGVSGEAVEPSVRVSGPVEGVSGEPGGSPAPGPPPESGPLPAPSVPSEPAVFAQDEPAVLAPSEPAIPVQAEPAPTAPPATLPPTLAPSGEAVLAAPPAHPDAPSAVRDPGGWQLAELERLVDRQTGEHPERAEEWRSYLFYLRDYVDTSGHVPAHFDWLIEDIFAEALVKA